MCGAVLPIFRRNGDSFCGWLLVCFKSVILLLYRILFGFFSQNDLLFPVSCLISSDLSKIFKDSKTIVAEDLEGRVWVFEDLLSADKVSWAFTYQMSRVVYHFTSLWAGGKRVLVEMEVNRALESLSERFFDVVPVFHD